MSPASLDMLRDTLSFPRVSGDEPADTDRLILDGEFSPRERG